MTYPDLVFDLYGTLVDIHTEETEAVWEKTALFFGFYGASYSGPQLCAAFSAVMEEEEGREGQSYECFPEIPVEQVMSRLFRRKGVEDPEGALGLQAAQLFRISSIDYIRLYPGVMEGLQELKRCGFRLWLLTNAQRAFTEYELRAMGISALFDGIYISSDHRCRKPDHRFFRVLLEERQLDPARCLMIGNDRETDIAGGKAAGMATLYLHTNLTPREQAWADPGQPFPHGEMEGCDWIRLARLLNAL